MIDSHEIMGISRTDRLGVVTNTLFLSIGITKMNKGQIYYYDEVIANDLNEFLNKFLTNEIIFLIDCHGNYAN